MSQKNRPLHQRQNTWCDMKQLLVFSSDFVRSIFSTAA